MVNRISAGNHFASLLFYENKWRDMTKGARYSEQKKHVHIDLRTLGKFFQNLMAAVFLLAADSVFGELASI